MESKKLDELISSATKKVAEQIEKFTNSKNHLILN